MKIKVTIVALVAIILASCASAPEARLNSTANILPRPTKLTHHEGVFAIDRNTTLCYEESVAKVADILCDYVPFTKRSTECCAENAVRLSVDNSLGKEAYTLTIDASGVTIKGGDYGGVLYGMESLLQLLPYEVFTKKAKLPLAAQFVEVEDSPRFPYRGMLLDMASNCYTMEEIKEQLDIYAMHKINYCQILIMTSGAWRFEIKSHPELAREGSFRGGDSKIRPHNNYQNEKRGCYYTQEQMKELIAYAADRNIEMIPEVGVPGHSHAITRVYPDVLCNYTPNLEKSNGYDGRSVWCVAKESNYALLDDIIREVASVFPSKYIHLGGDEVKFSQWIPCPDCQALAKRLGIEVGPELQEVFMERARAIVKKYGKMPAMYDEAIDGGNLSKETIIYAWRNIKWTHETTKRGYPTIVMPGESFYFDTRQSDSEVGHHWSFAFDVKHIVDWTFESQGFTKEQLSNIIGVEGAYWGCGRNNWEHYFTQGYKTGSMTYYNYMSYPRFSAYAEIAWCHNKRNWEEFKAFMNDSWSHTLEALGLEYRLSTPAVAIEGEKLVASVEDGSTLYYEDIRTGKVKRYSKPLAAEDAKYTLFFSRRGTGISKKVGEAAYYATLSPKYEVTSSFNLTYADLHPVLDHYKWKTDRGVKRGDWVLFTLEEPLSCFSVEVRTGYTHAASWFIYDADVEVSYDGVKFEKKAKLWYGSATLRPTKPIHAIRIAVNADMPYHYAIIQPLVVK